jgi:integration host factor subunit beta
MKRSELIENIALKHKDLEYKDAVNVVDAMFAEISNCLKRGYRVELRGFGVFSAKERNFSKARNPKTGDQVAVSPRKNVKFKMSTKLQEILNK